MKNKPIKNYWNSQDFIKSYKTLDQEWQTKLALYCEAISAAASIKALNNRLSVLDLGGGLGTLRTMTPDDFGKYPIDLWTVCDSSLEMLTSGIAFQLPAEQPTYFVQADIQSHLPFSANSFDIVFCINFLYLFTDSVHTTTVAPQITRILRDNGLLIAITPIPKANNRKIIIDEIGLRSKNSRFSTISIVSVLKDIVTNLHFLSAQGKIINMANKKFPADWAQLYTVATHKKLEPCLCKLTQSYGGQAGLWVLQKRNL